MASDLLAFSSQRSAISSLSLQRSGSHPQSDSRRSGADGRRLFADRFLNPVVALLFQLERQFLAAGADDAPAIEHVHVVGHDVVEKALVVRDEDDGVLRRAQTEIGRASCRERVEIAVGAVSLKT